MRNKSNKKMILVDQTKIFINIIFSNNLCLCSLWCQYYIYSGIRHRGTFFSYIVRRTPKWTPIFKKKSDILKAKKSIFKKLHNMDIDPLLCKDYLQTKLIWLIDNCFHLWIPAYICERTKKDGNQKRNIAFFVARAFGNSN